LRELRRVLGYDRLNLSDSEQADHFAMATTTATVVAPTEDITEIEADPDDDMFLECASAADADYLISGDTHLLDLGSFQGIPVLSPDEFLREWGK
jgi:putative PIN family toxin of toxin-antitoxin system